ncbi:pyridoxamine 5'-phosphate oxidase family protein [Mycobacterium syngnathidarum]|uniref:Pyridoxamine 5'-phosphate oxidase n=1 Tax=Mycobacterium syngnathidarum TaxID=1908205 RepID=A0A1S1KM82_9MYCO|nr:pyridoxamine 5'-phosphate oxidase [Mycobacterium syngnathidarum]OLT98608.1 pyridoxamine 5'-phosphate oxidase [Mycobacterium syngnathidarum]
MLTEPMKAMLATQLPIVASVTDSGTPNVGPKRSLRVYGDGSLIFNENTGGQTLTNIRNGSKIAVAVIDRDALDGFRFLGTPTLHDSGPAFDNAVAFATDRGMKSPHYAVVVTIDTIYTLKPGPTAGNRVTSF